MCWLARTVLSGDDAPLYTQLCINVFVILDTTKTPVLSVTVSPSREADRIESCHVVNRGMYIRLGSHRQVNWQLLANTTYLTRIAI